MIERKVKGAIFRGKGGKYFKKFTYGETDDIAKAHVYSCDEIRDIQLSRIGWGSKCDGTWLLVYE